jgi:hypothetical protein
MWRHHSGRVWIGVRRQLETSSSRAWVLRPPPISVISSSSSTCCSTSTPCRGFKSSETKRGFCYTARDRVAIDTGTSTTANVTQNEDMGAKGTQTVDTSLRLQNIRRLMRQGDVAVDAFIVPSEDQREFLLFCKVDIS